MIQQILNTEEVSYSSNLNAESLKQRIEDIFAQSSLRFKGKLTSEDEFSAYSKLVVIGWSMPNLKRKAAYLTGKITAGEKGTTVNLAVNPNSILPIFAILATLVGLILSLVAFSSTQDDKFLLFIGSIFMVLGLVYYPLSSLFRNRLRNQIVKSLGLNKL